MDASEYRRRGKEMVDYIADYLEDIRSRPVFPSVVPGYMRELIPDSAPETGEKWDDIFHDVERVIMPGITHWQSPFMHAYFPALNSYPSLLGDMLADAIGCLGFTWASSPACTELETIVMDWLGKMIGLPSAFLHSNQQTRGGGVLQTTASEATLVSVLAARSVTIKRCKAGNPELSDIEINSRLVGYCSDQAHSSVEKAGLIGFVKLRFLPCDDKLSLRGDVLREAVKRDRENGLIPFYLCATLGTTGACAFDNLKELGPIVTEEDMWMHIDAAYAGTAFLCPEYRYLMEGIEHAESFAFNPSKWMMVHFDCTAMWVQNSGALHGTFNVNPIYLRHENTGAAIDYMHWQIPLSRRFRALKLWFTIRSFGIEGLQAHVRKGVRLAKMFQTMVDDDDRFEIPAERYLGMVVLRLKGQNELTETLLKRLNKSGKLHMVPASFKGKYVMRFTVTSTHTTEKDLQRDWRIIQCMARRVLAEDAGEEIEDEPLSVSPVQKDASKVLSAMGQHKREGMRRKDFGLSLILSNVPMSPKFINGSFAALFDANDIIVEYAKHLGRSSVDLNGQPIRLSPRKRMKEHSKQYSFDLNTAPCIKPSLEAFKQRSLDSKIEELFDATAQDSDASESADNDQSNGAQSRPKSIIYLRHIQPPGSSTNGVIVNGVAPLKCKHCGHPVEG